MMHRISLSDSFRWCLGRGIMVCALWMTASACQAGPRHAAEFSAATGSPYRVGPKVTSVAAADLNGDGFVDVVAGHARPAGEGSQAGGITVLFGDGGGRFSGSRLIPLEGAGIQVCVADVNGDRHPDIVAVRHDSHDVYIIPGGPASRFVAGSPHPQTRVSGKPHTHALALADFDADGHTDLATTNADDDSVSVLLGDGRGAFRPAAGSPFAVGRTPYEGMVALDIDRDARIDLIMPLVGDRAVGILRGDGRGGFGSVRKVPVGRPLNSIGLHDLNRDGLPDLILPDESLPGARWMFNDGRGAFAEADGARVRLPIDVWAAATADLDGDGGIALVLGGRGSSIYCVRLDRGGIPHSDPLSVATGGRDPGALAVADVNRDGTPDVITGNFVSGDVSVLLAQ